MIQLESGPPRVEERKTWEPEPSGRRGAAHRAFWPECGAGYTAMNQPGQECLGSG